MMVTYDSYCLVDAYGVWVYWQRQHEISHAAVRLALCRAGAIEVLKFTFRAIVCIVMNACFEPVNQ